MISGGGYALCLGLARLRQGRWWSAAALAAYAALLASAIWLMRLLDLRGFWLIVVLVMSLGYFVLPRAVWQLCVGTHVGESEEGGR